MSGKVRQLTLVISVDQPDANWIWDSHIKNTFVNGVLVEKIAEGDMMDLKLDDED